MLMKANTPRIRRPQGVDRVGEGQHADCAYPLGRTLGAEVWEADTREAPAANGRRAPCMAAVHTKRRRVAANLSDMGISRLEYVWEGHE